MLVPALLEG